jgi:hypothetical protein
MKKRSRRHVDVLNKVADMVLEGVAATSKPYDRRSLAALTSEQQVKVSDAEMDVYMYVMVGWNRANDLELKEWSQEFNVKYGIESGDEERIDEPLRKMRELAKAYAVSGLASDETEAKRMAEGFKDAVVRHCRQKFSERGA